MEKIRKYVDKFFKGTKRNIRYMISLEECKAFVHAIKNKDEFDGIFVVSDAFDFGYAKGYRVAMAEIKKGGVA